MKKVVGIDIETTGLDIISDEIASIQIYHPETEDTDFIPVNMKGLSLLSDEEVRMILQDLCDKYRVVGFNLNFDLGFIARYGVYFEIAGDAETYFRMSRACQGYPQNRRSLKDLSEHFLGRTELLRFEDICPTLNFSDLHCQDPEAIKYANADPELAYLLFEYLKERYPENLEVFHEEMRAKEVFIKASNRGMYIDPQGVQILESQLSAKLAVLNNKMAAQVGFSFRPNSAKDLPEVFKAVGLDIPSPSGKSGRPSFKAAVLESYLPHPLIEDIIKARGLIYTIPRLQNTLVEYIKGDGRLHPSYEQVGWSGSARVYTAHPSTNSLPMAARRYIKPEEGNKFIYADWSQAEFILACQLAGEDELVEAYFDGFDVMKATASKCFNVPMEEVSDDQREVSKVVQYASMYGSEGISVANALKEPRRQGEERVYQFWESLPELKRFRDQIIKRAHENLYTETLTGFKRFLPEIESWTRGLQKENERRAFNTAMQSGVANLFKQAIVKLDKVLPERCFFYTGVFDSFLLEVPKEMRKESFEDLLESISTFQIEEKEVRFRFSLSEGENWAEAQGK